MKWNDLTDILTCTCFDHLIVIEKRGFGGDVFRWWCQDPNDNIIEEGKTAKLTEAKRECRRLYDVILRQQPGVYVTSGGKLRVRK